MATRDLSRLLRPRSVAVIGGGAWCRAVVRGLQNMGFAGAIWPVHPTATEIEGMTVLASLAALPEAPDAAFVGINAAASVDAVRLLATRGAGGAVCFAAGFSETGAGADLQDALVTAAGEMPVLGPNCYGFVNALDGVPLWPDIHGLRRVERGVAILAQSSNVALNLTMQMRGLPIAFMGTVGNQAQVGMAELAAGLLQDDRVTALGLYVEGFGDLRALEDLADMARTTGKPIVVLKTGRTEAAQLAALSHTAALSGQDAGADALCGRLGLARVTTLAGFLEALKFLHLVGPLPANTIAALSCSGGEASLVADAAAPHGLEFAPLSDIQKTALSDVLGSRVALANPLDYNTYIWADVEPLTRAYAAMMRGAAVITLLIVDFPRPDRCEAEGWDILVEAAARAQRVVGMPMAIVSTLPETMTEARAEALIAVNLVPLSGLEAALEAVAAAVTLGGLSMRPEPLLRPAVHGTLCVLDEEVAKAALSRYGLSVPRSTRAPDVETAVIEAAGRWPVVLKRTGLAHKSDVGGVALDLRDEASVRCAVGRMGPGPYLVEDMLAPGTELLVGVVADPAHGYLLSLGQGGVLTELAVDVVHLLLPASRDEIDAALSRLRMAPLFGGYRGRSPLARAALLDAVMAIQDYVLASDGAVAEVEVNPLIVTAASATAADALIILGDRP